MTKDCDDHFRMGVGMVMINKDNKVFAGKRSTTNTKMVSWFLKKPWQMPQGGIEPGEEPIEAALRELLEEVGTDKVEVLAETDNWLEYNLPVNLRRKNNPMVGQRQKWFLMKFLGSDEDIDLNYSTHREFDVWRWMSYQNLIRLSVHFKRRLYIDVFKQFRSHLAMYNPTDPG
ncbi:MAG: RNA pyrophosphohydrolase [Holosporales bacterium]|jgi:putative (di)nucleoside polyphosphate hydrolase|nr:RNA pyrophosphohydrolase [Holosporales bacterium]